MTTMGEQDHTGSIGPDEAVKKSNEDLERARHKAGLLRDLAQAMSLRRDENHFGKSIRRALGL